jgi:hypothetical protein
MIRPTPEPEKNNSFEVSLMVITYPLIFLGSHTVFGFKALRKIGHGTKHAQ